MQVSVFEASVQQFVVALTGLKALLKKAESSAQSRKFDMSVLLETRLFPDMFPLGKQIQTACDAAKFCGSRLSQTTPPVFDDQEKNLSDYLERIEQTISYLKALKEEDFKDYEQKEIIFPWNPTQKLMGKDYLIQFALPNFYFHLTTAYNILRSCGIEIGKADYLGKINWQPTAHPGS